MRVCGPPKNSPHISVLTSPVALQQTRLDLMAVPLEMQSGFVLLVGSKIYFFVAGLKTAKFPISGPRKEHIPPGTVSTPKSSSSNQTGQRRAMEGRTRSDLRDPNCPTTAHPLTPSKAIPTPEASPSCWDHWKRKIHALKLYGKSQSLPSLCSPHHVQ